MSKYIEVVYTSCGKLILQRECNYIIETSVTIAKHAWMGDTLHSTHALF